MIRILLDSGATIDIQVFPLSLSLFHSLFLMLQYFRIAMDGQLSTIVVDLDLLMRVLCFSLTLR